MKTEQIVETLVDKNRSRWGVVMALGLIYVMFDGEWWWLFPFAGIAFVSYHIMLALTISYLGATLGSKTNIEDQLAALGELNRRLAAGEEDGPELEELKRRAGVNDGQTVRVSDGIVGKYGDHSIYEWIEITNSDGTHRYEFHDVAPKDAGGNPMIPMDGETYAHLHGINYKRAST